jgi:uncharacterized protein
MTLKGTVTNVTNFGAFVDIGVHQDGLVHISELSDQFVKDPSEVVAVGTVLTVRVLDVDVPRRRISLSCKSKPTEKGTTTAAASSSGDRRPQDQRGARAGGSAHGGGGYRGSPGGQQQSRNKPSKPDKTYTMNDLLAKFGKKGD